MAKSPIIDLTKSKSDFSPGSGKWELISLSINLMYNTPPRIACRAVPASFLQKKVVDTSNADLFWNAAAKSDSVVGKPEAKLSFSVKGPSVFEFDASGWVLGDIGVSASATSESPAAIDFTLLHPISLLSKYPVNIGPVNNNPPVDLLTGDNYIEVAKSALKLYSDNLHERAKKQPTYKLLQEGIGQIDNYVSCRACNISKLANLFSWYSDTKTIEQGFRRFVFSCIESGSGAATLFSLFAQALASELSLGLYPGGGNLGSSKMTLMPSRPWTSDCCVVHSNSIINVFTNTGDWLSPSGLFTSMSQLQVPVYNAPEKGESNATEPLYASVVAKDGGVQTVPVSIPGWVNAILGHTGQIVHYNAPEQVESPELLDLNNPEHVKTVQKILSQYLLDMYRQTKSISVNRLFSHVDSTGKLLLPGRSCLVTGKGKRGLLFLITNVTHQIDLMQNSASTQISGNYLRGSDFSLDVEGADPENLIKDGFCDINCIWG